MGADDTKPAEKVRATTRTARIASATVVEQAKARLESVSETQIKAADEFAAIGKSNVEAIIQAGTSLFRGAEELTRGLVGLSQSQFEAGISAAKAMLGAKTLSELAELQNQYSKSAFDQVVAESTRLSELAVKVTNEALEPIQARLNATVEQFTKPLVAA